MTPLALPNGYDYMSHPPLLLVAPPPLLISAPRLAKLGDALDGYSGPGNSATSTLAASFVGPCVEFSLCTKGTVLGFLIKSTDAMYHVKVTAG
jgi:hypothetical protein